MGSSLLASLLFLAGPGFKLDGTYLMPGVDLSPRPGIEVSLVHNSVGLWAGPVLAAAYDLETEKTHFTGALSLGFLFFGAEAGLALRQDGEVAHRLRALLTAGPLGAYVEHMGVESPWSGGVLIKVPVEL